MQRPSLSSQIACFQNAWGCLILHLVYSPFLVISDLRTLNEDKRVNPNYYGRQGCKDLSILHELNAF